MVTGKNILFVDDEKHIRELYGDVLEEAGHEVKKADTAEFGLDLFMEHRDTLDLVVLDIKFPFGEKNGLDLLQDIRSVDLKIPVMLLSAYDSFRHDLRSIAADSYVVKSMDQTEFLDEATNLLRKRPIIYRDLKSGKVFEGKDTYSNPSIIGMSFTECHDLPYTTLDGLKNGKSIDVAVATVGKRAGRVVDFHHAAREIDPYFMTILCAKKGPVQDATGPGIVQADLTNSNGAYVRMALRDALLYREQNMDVEYRRKGNDGIFKFKF